MGGLAVASGLVAVSPTAGGAGATGPTGATGTAGGAGATGATGATGSGPATVTTTLCSAVTPASTGVSDSSAYELGMRFTVNVAGQVTKIRYYKDAADLTATHTGRLWNADTTTQIGSVVFTGESASGWQEMALASPVSITTGVNYAVSVNVDNNNGGNSKWIKTTSGFPGNSGCFIATQGSLPTTFNTTNYFRDVVFAATASGPVSLNVSALRIMDQVANVVYRNNSGRGMAVNLSARCSISLAGGQAYASPLSDSTATPAAISGRAGIQAGLLNEDNTFQLSFFVNAGENYGVVPNTTNGTITFNYWFETLL